MKKLVFMLMALILPVSLFAAEVEPSTGSEFVINLGTFTGIVTLVSSLVTQMNPMDYWKRYTNIYVRMVLYQKNW